MSKLRMKNAKIAVGLLFAVLAGNAWAEVYRCDQNGKVLYTDRRCKDAERVKIESIKPERAAEAAKSLEQIELELAEKREKDQEQAQIRAEQAQREAARREEELQSQQQLEQMRRNLKFPGRVYNFSVP